ncbi:ABC transporter permease [Rhodoligotrophos defluvii]|uniref:ABC transporter permease n=1 Tax=Rhodoligotrophos defluvii TaxID=2561934 RepID=UPI001EEFF90F|nr:ABC transporter permease [Rhodoligotrophos defluvii]
MSEQYDLPLSKGLLGTFTAVLLVLLVAPALIVIPISFSAGTIMTFPLPGLSLRWYEEVLFSPAWRNAVSNTALIGTAAAALATLIGTMAAIGIDRLRNTMKTATLLLSIFPLMVPIVIAALGGYLALVSVGLNNTYWGAILLHAMLGLPFVTISVLAALQGFDRNLWRAASSLGAKPLTIFRRVMLPIILPGIVTGAVFAFATSLDEVVIASFVTAPAQKTIPLQMFSGIKDNTGPNVTAAATILLLLSAVFLAVVEMLRRRSQRLVGSRPLWQ